MRQIGQCVVIGAVHEIAATGEKPEDDRQQYQANRTVQDVIVPPLGGQHAMTVIVAKQEKDVEIERALNGHRVAQMCESAQDGKCHRDADIQPRLVE